MRGRGFTLVELVVTIVMLGILSVVALPRLFSRADYESRGFYDETKALLRYAQKQAIAQRRTVCVALENRGVGLSIAGSAGATSCNTALALPAPPRGGSGLVPSVDQFKYVSSGATDQSADIIVNIVGVNGTIVVDRGSGYVR